MQWSKLKKRVEQRFTPLVAHRVSIHLTTYRRPRVFRQGRGWVSVDGEEVFTASEEQYGRGVIKHGGAHGDAYFALEPILSSEGYFSEASFLSSLHESLLLSITDALESPNVLIRGIARLDSRVGRRRLSMLKAEGEHPFIALLMNVRLQSDPVLARLGKAL